MIGFEPRPVLAKLLPSRRVDPRVEVDGTFDVIRKTLQKTTFRLERDDPEFDIMRAAALFLVCKVDALAKLDIWQSLWTSEKPGGICVPEPDRIARWNKITEARELLRNGKFSIKAFVSTMDTAHESAHSMERQFKFAEAPFEWFAEASERYRDCGLKAQHDVLACAALLTPILTRFESDWIPLRKQIFKRNPIRFADYDKKSGFVVG